MKTHVSSLFLIFKNSIIIINNFSNITGFFLISFHRLESIFHRQSANLKLFLRIRLVIKITTHPLSNIFTKMRFLVANSVLPF